MWFSKRVVRFSKSAHKLCVTDDAIYQLCKSCPCRQEKKLTPRRLTLLCASPMQRRHHTLLTLCDVGGFSKTELLQQCRHVALIWLSKHRYVVNMRWEVSIACTAAHGTSTTHSNPAKQFRHRHVPSPRCFAADHIHEDAFTSNAVPVENCMHHAFVLNIITKLALKQCSNTRLQPEIMCKATSQKWVTSSVRSRIRSSAIFPSMHSIEIFRVGSELYNPGSTRNGRPVSRKICVQETLRCHRTERTYCFTLQ